MRARESGIEIKGEHKCGNENAAARLYEKLSQPGSSSRIPQLDPTRSSRCRICKHAPRSVKKRERDGTRERDERRRGEEETAFWPP